MNAEAGAGRKVWQDRLLILKDVLCLPLMQMQQCTYAAWAAQLCWDALSQGCLVGRHHGTGSHNAKYDLLTPLVHPQCHDHADSF